MSDRKCFIISPLGTDLSDLIPIVVEAKWRVLNLEGVSPDSEEYLVRTSDLIAHANALIALLDHKPNPSILLQIGFALGAGKPLLVLGDPTRGGLSMPSDLIASVSFVDATIRDQRALRLHVNAFLEGVTSRRSLQESASPLPKGRRSPSDKIDRWLDSDLERQIAESLQKSFEVVQAKSQPLDHRKRAYIPDFVVWLSGDAKQFGNPVAIEAKSHLREGRQKEQVIDRFSKYASIADVSTFLLVVANDPKEPVRLISVLPFVFQVGVETFDELCIAGKLVDSLRRERNRFFHSVV